MPRTRSTSGVAARASLVEWELDLGAVDSGVTEDPLDTAQP